MKKYKLISLFEAYSKSRIRWRYINIRWLSFNLRLLFEAKGCAWPVYKRIESLLMFILCSSFIFTQNCFSLDIAFTTKAIFERNIIETNLFPALDVPEPLSLNELSQSHKIHFIKSSRISVIQQIGEVTYDSTKVESGDSYLFKLDYSSIAGITSDKVIMQGEGSETELYPDANGVYTLSQVNNDIIIKIALTPSIVVTTEESEFGVLSITRQSDKLKIPDGTNKNSITVYDNEFIRLDTVSFPGYYCDAVFMQSKESSDIPVKDKVGKDNGIQVKEDVCYKAEFKPCSYPVILQVNDPDMGQLTVKNNKDAETYTLPLGSANFQKAVEYSADKTFSITVANNPGYGIKSVKIYDADGVSNPKDLTSAVDRVADIRVGGLVIDVVFEPVQYTVYWNCSNGDLKVTPGTEINIDGGGKKIETAYGEVITIQPLANVGYEYKPNSLKVQLGDGSQQAVPDGTKQWTVLENVILSAQFSRLRPLVTIEIDQPTGATNGVNTTPVLGADQRVSYGSSLTLEPAAKTGYHCSEIWVDGVKQVGNSSVGLPSIEQDVTVKFVFVPDEFQITYVNTTPSFGTLLVERQQNGETGWTSYTGSPGKANYLDKIKVTATPTNEHCLLDVLTLTSTSAGQTNIVSGTEQEVKEALTVNASFKPKEYPVTLNKIGTERTSGKILLKDIATGSVLIELDRAEETSTAYIPYGTEILIEWECDRSYGMKSLDKITTGTESVLASRAFTVEGQTEIQAEIYQSTKTYSVKWEIVQPNGSIGNDLNVYETTEGDIAQGDTRVEGSLLTIKTETAASDTLISLTDQNGNALSSPYSLNQDLEITATFVRKCTVRIVSPTGATVVVSKDGVNLPDGAIVPTGSVLQSVITANNSSIGCKSLTINSVPQWTGTITTTSPPPSTSGNISYVISTAHSGGEIWFGGTVDTYYSVKYTAANFGSFAVKVEADGITEELVPDQEYWYPGAGANLMLEARETVAGYVFNADRKIVNKAVIPNEDINLLENNEGYSWSEPLNKDMDLATAFEVDRYEVALNVVLPSGKTLAEVGSMTLTGGTSSLYDRGNTKVNYNGVLTLNVTSQAGYAVRIKEGDIIKQSGFSGTYVYSTLPARANIALEVEYIPRYQVNYGTDIANGERVYAGEILKAYSAVPPETGKECKEVAVKDAISGNTYGSSTTPLANGTIEYEFPMPGADVKVEARFDWVNYDLSLNDPGNAAVLKVVKIVGGIEIPVTAGTDVLSYGDNLKVIITMPSVGGSSDTWYEVSSFSAVMGGNNVPVLSSVSGLDYEYTFNIPVSGDVDITSVVVRKMRDLIARVTPANSGPTIKVQVEDEIPVEYDSYQSIRVPVGVSVEAWAQPAIGHELTSFPGVGERNTHVSKTVSLVDDLYLSAVFSLKPCTLIVVQPDNGIIRVEVFNQGRWDPLDISSLRFLNYGTQVKVHVIANSDYEVTRVTANNIDIANGGSLIMEEDVTIAAECKRMTPPVSNERILNQNVISFNNNKVEINTIESFIQISLFIITPDGRVIYSNRDYKNDLDVQCIPKGVFYYVVEGITTNKMKKTIAKGASVIWW
ncbi:hypothetical protein [Parabacteroides bouchesdurhonensis]|uniref:hypothetical protein n=1 Tax=Parabacteroides bouchesdurhonensis TaxID=1936995 RepID=UPI000C861B2C|nr:hypothetical protein [Parabacteroides bouchesdurhonensis]